MISIKQLTKSYASVVALHPLDLEIERGEIFGYVGPNGSGKTTTIRMLCGLLLPSGGGATVGGIDVVHEPKRVRNQVGYMPDHVVPYEGMRVWEYLDFFGAAYQLRRAERRTKVDQAIALTGIEQMRDYFVETLSHGMCQRLGLARTLVHDPEVLFLDEPTNGLDPRARVEMRLMLQQLKDMGKTILISSHILPELAHVCDRVGFMEQGKLLACGTVAEVQRTVRPHRIFEIEVLDDPESVKKAAAELVAQDKLAGASLVGNLVRVELEGDDKDMAALLNGLARQGHSIMGFREVVGDLEEAYLALTTEGAFGMRSSDEA